MKKVGWQYQTDMYLFFFFFFFCRTDMLCLLACFFSLLLACTWHLVCFSETSDCWDVLNILEQSVQVVKKPEIRVISNFQRELVLLDLKKPEIGVISNFQRKLVLLLLFWLFCFTCQKIKHMSSSVLILTPNPCWLSPWLLWTSFAIRCSTTRYQCAF